MNAALTIIFLITAAAVAAADDCLTVDLAFHSVTNYNRTIFTSTNSTCRRRIQSLSMANKNLAGAVSWSALANLSSLRILDVSGNELTGAISGKLWRSPSLRRVDLSKNRLGGALRFTPSNLTSLNLSRNRFTAVDGVAALTALLVLDLSGNRVRLAPPGMSSLRNLRRLDLSGNGMRGVFPGDFPPLAGLKFLNLSFNNFSGEVEAAVVKKFGPSAFIDSGSLIFLSGKSATPTSPPATASKKRPNNTTLLAVSIASGFAGVVIALGIAVCVAAAKRRKKKGDQSAGAGAGEESAAVSEWVSAAKSAAPVVMFERPLMSLTFADMVTATSGFGSESRLADRGGRSGAAYRAVLPGDMHVVVRVVDRVAGAGGGAAGDEEDVAAAAACRELARLRHPNLLPLLGYCIAGKEKLLLYEYMHKGDLHRWLHELPVGRPDADDNAADTWDSSGVAGRASVVTGVNQPRMDGDWPTRHRMALGVARGLAFLHQGWAGRPVVHGHLVLTNILLDDALEPRISDFGNPNTGRPEDDVYSFGVVLLELMTGRSRWDDAAVAWARVVIRDGNGGELVDPRIRAGDPNPEWEGEMDACLRVGYLCTAHPPDKRPRAQQLVGLLKDIRPSSTVDDAGLGSSAAIINM